MMAQSPNYNRIDLPRRDWLPGDYSNAHVFANDFYSALDSHGLTLGMTAQEVTDYRATINAFIQLVEVRFNPENATTQFRNELRKAFGLSNQAIRQVVRQFIRRNDLVTPTILADFNIPEIDNIRTQNIIVRDTVEAVFRVAPNGSIVIDFWPEGSNNKARPEAAIGVEIRCKFSETAPTNIDEMNEHILFASRRPFGHDFGLEYSGARVWISCAWVNRRGNKGTFSPPISYMIQ